MTPIFRPSHPCPNTGCPGHFVLERHLATCECTDPWSEPCASCQVITDQLILEGWSPDKARTGPRPWVLCDACDWAEKDGGLTGHQLLDWMAWAEAGRA